MRRSNHLALVMVLLAAPGSAWSQLKEVRVAGPTRLDWEFAARGFKTEKLPAAYQSKNQRYQLFVPRNYKADRDWPLVLFISAGDTPAGWSAWKSACEKHGVFFCSPYKAGNSCPSAQRVRIVLDMLDDVRRNYRIDPDQTYASGFSGGARMACAIAFALPEWFGGVVPVCGTNPIVGPNYLRHRVEDRLAVAFITGDKDFNRKENEVYMYPYFQELGIHSKLWVVPNLGHAVPSAAVIGKVYGWLAEDLPRRLAEAKAHPALAMSAAETPSAADQARRYLEAAAADLKDAKRVWRGVTLLQGIIARWRDTEAGQQARATLKGLVNDEKLLQAVADQGSDDEQRSLSAQAKAFERFGQTKLAFEAWELLARNQPDTPAGKNAAEQAKRLRAKAK